MIKFSKKIVLLFFIVFCFFGSSIKCEAINLEKKDLYFIEKEIIKDLKILRKITFCNNSQFWANKYGFISSKDIENIKIFEDKKLFYLRNKNTSILLNKDNYTRDFFHKLKKSYKNDNNSSFLNNFRNSNNFLTFNNIKVYPYFTVKNINNQTKFANTYIDVKEGADDIYDKIFTLSLNDDVIIIGISNTGWYKIIYNDKEGFVKTSQLSNERIITKNPEDYGYSVLGNCKEINTMNSYMSKVPQNIFNFIFSNGWNIYLTDENLAQTEFNGIYKSIMGATILTTKTIKIEDRKNAIKEALFHELGHAIDWYNGSIKCNYCNSDEFINIFNAERISSLSLSGTSQHTISGIHEYFAECINQYLSNTENFKKICPLSYTYVSNIIQNL